MAASVANSRKALTSGATSTTCASFTSTTGDTIFVTVSDASGQSGVTITDNKSNTYTQVGTTQVSALGGSQLRRFACQNANGGAGHTVTATWAANSDAVVCVFDLTGVLAASLDKSAQADDSSSPWTVTSATLTQADEIAISAVSGSWSGTFSESSGFTIDQQEGNNSLYWTSAAGSKVVSATTALTPSWSITGGGSGSAVTIDTFKASAGGGGTSLTPGAGSIALAGFAPTVARTANQALVPGVGALSFTGQVPTIARTANQAVAPGVGALTFTGYAPTVSQSSGVNVSPSAAAITFAGYAPTIAQPKAVNPGAGALSFTGYAPSIAQPLAVAPGAGAIAFTGYAPTLAQTANQALTPGAGSLALTGFAPIVTQVSQSPNLTPGAGVLTITGYVPTVTGTQPATFPGFEVDQRRRRLPERTVKPMLVRAMERRLQNVKPPKERAAVRAKAIEFEAAALVLDGATQREIAPLLQQWEAQRPYIPPQLADVPTLDVFLSQVGFRIEQAQAQKTALEAIATARRQDEDALLALLLA